MLICQCAIGLPLPPSTSPMPARALFLAAFVMLTAGSTWAQVEYQRAQPEGEGPSQPPPSEPTPTPGPAVTTPTDKSQVWGALAFTADGSWATAWLKPSKAEAESNVAVACAKFGRGGCEIVSFNGEYCAALATYIGAHCAAGTNCPFPAAAARCTRRRARPWTTATATRARAAAASCAPRCAATAADLTGTCGCREPGAA